MKVSMMPKSQKCHSGTVSYLSPALYLQDVSSISTFVHSVWKLKIYLVDKVLVTNKKQCCLVHSVGGVVVLR